MSVLIGETEPSRGSHHYKNEININFLLFTIPTFTFLHNYLTESFICINCVRTYIATLKGFDIIKGIS